MTYVANVPLYVNTETEASVAVDAQAELPEVTLPEEIARLLAFDAIRAVAHTPATVDDLDALTVAELHALAQERDIDLGSASKKPDIVAAIQLATPPIED